MRLPIKITGLRLQGLGYRLFGSWFLDARNCALKINTLLTHHPTYALSRLGFTIRPELFEKNYKQFGVIVNPLRGFTIIEFLIVITILGITGTLVSTSYLSFDKRQKIKNETLEIKSQLRFARNNAITGNKGIRGSNSDFCADTSTLVGWYSLIDTNDNSITNAGVCSTGGVEKKFKENKVFVDEAIEFSALTLKGTDPIQILIFYQSTKSGALYYQVKTTNDPPIVKASFVDSKGEVLADDVYGDLKKDESVVLGIAGRDDPSGTSYIIEIQSSGEISELKLDD